MHDFLTVAAPTPFHDAGVAAMSLPDEFYKTLAADYEQKRGLMLDILGRHGFTAWQPGGAYYVMADVSRFGFSSDSEFAHYLVKEIGVATVPGSSFYIDPAAAPASVRFCFSKRDETLFEADRRLARLRVT
jgi:aminotransferase